MQSDLNGRHVERFFRSGYNMCNCPRRLSTVVSAMTIDDTNIHSPMIYWMSVEGNLYAADIYGCMCKEVLNWDVNEETSSLTVDKKNVYWSSVEEDRIYFLKKEPYASMRNSSEVNSLYLPTVRSITALGESLQSYPNASCLVPRQEQYKVARNKTTSNSIIVNLPEPTVENGCERYNLPATLYIVSVSRCLDTKSVNGIKECKTGEETTIRTYEQHHEIGNLKPFTVYTLRLALSNHYAKPMNPRFGPSVTLMTGPGIPSAPENVTVQVLTPMSAAVYWAPPKILNSASVYYEIHWRSIGLVDGVRQRGEQLKKEPERTADGRFIAILQPLLHGQEYLVYVRVYPENYSNNYNESTSKTIRMYPEPNNLTVSGVTMDSLNISWVPSNLTLQMYTLQYTDVAVEQWQTASDSVRGRNNVTYHIRGLQPRTLYKFRLLLRYPAYKEDFVWSPDAKFTFQTLGKILEILRVLVIDARVYTR